MKNKMALIVVFILSIGTTLYAQGLRVPVIDVVQAHGVDVVYSPPADQFADYLLRILVVEGEQRFNQALNSSDDSWYAGMDIYMGEDEQTLLADIEFDGEANYFLDATQASVSVAYFGGMYMVVITSYQ